VYIIERSLPAMVMDLWRNCGEIMEKNLQDPLIHKGIKVLQKYVLKLFSVEISINTK
jgi:hypothetical protein